MCPLLACATSSSHALREAYASLSSKWLTSGFDTHAIAGVRASFTDHGTQPRIYEDPPWRMPVGSVRVIALSLEDNELVVERSKIPKISRHAAERVADVLPTGTSTWMQPEGTMHATIFHPGLSPTFSHGEPLASGPSASFLQAELRAAREMVKRLSLPPDGLKLIADRFVMTTSGVLLLLLRTADECASGINVVERLRAAAASTFPYAASKQVRRTLTLLHALL